jgi:hypothetical protein
VVIFSAAYKIGTNVDISRPMDEIKEIYCNNHDNGSARMVFLFNYDDDFVPVKMTCGPLGSILDNEENDSASYLVGINVDRNNIVFEVYREVMTRIISTGIPQHLRNDFHTLEQLSYPVPADSEPEVLSLTSLEFGFVIWLISLTVAVVPFICELLMWPRVIRQKAEAKAKKRQDEEAKAKQEQQQQQQMKKEEDAVVEVSVAGRRWKMAIEMVMKGLMYDSNSSTSDQDEPIVVVVEVHVEPKEIVVGDEIAVDSTVRKRPSVVTLDDVDDILAIDLENDDK